MTQINKPVTGIQLALSRAIPDVSAGTGFIYLEGIIERT